MKKFISMMIAVFAIGTSAYAIEVSVGVSLGGGAAFLRGQDVASFESDLGVSKPFGFVIKAQADVMVEFMPFLALETGVGFGGAQTVYNVDAGQGNTGSIDFVKGGIEIPIMVRGQYEYGLGVTYGSVGVKLGIPLGDFATVSGDYGDAFEALTGTKTIMKKSDFYMDIALAVGQEFRLGDANYLGLRVGYDINVIRSYDTKLQDDLAVPKPDMFMDGLSFLLTYRYAFNSKWKN